MSDIDDYENEVFEKEPEIKPKKTKEEIANQRREQLAKIRERLKEKKQKLKVDNEDETGLNPINIENPKPKKRITKRDNNEDLMTLIKNQNEELKKLSDEITNIKTKKPIEKPVEKPIEKPIEKPVQTPIQKPVQAPIQKPVQAPIQKPIAKPQVRRLFNSVRLF